ncbi:tRNA uridine-5-carboxymethylaminomethyl(34) synthesis GTPase MnmE [Terriglobus roseus]|uniref:tRNA modification GTPase MnmE n=1 Tax=Terriglobus roseus TaxID=392734 RepID=A0A1H4NKH5_9BACT|nr:tRNA uridine-5-carboxymethylaminomethyl(34) synthesis GTPase MnmE [Terriglobus roseus]SEB95726.1 tRNA modification GTPase trmE [Terriglobus roseus]
MTAATLLDDTSIVAIATPAGRGGIGIVRLSGPAAITIAQNLVPSINTNTPRLAQYAILRDESGARVDDALITFFKAPHSYTGEDLVEIATHGAPVVLDWLVRACVDRGAQPARPGEFTERAFLRGRLDLTEAEAVRDLIDAQTLGQAKLAAQQMGGSIATAIRPAKDALISLIAALEAGIDFAEDDLDTLSAAEIDAPIAAIETSLNTLLTSFAHGRLMREGLRLAIVGRPNAGKSSLFNRLVERDRAIVTATPGTTRDVISEHISMEGVPVELLDTAGLRETVDEAESMGVARSRQTIADADAVLLVVDATAAETDEEVSLKESLLGRPVIEVRNKIDLLRERLPDEVSWTNQRSDFTRQTIWVSAVSGEGVEALRAGILSLARGSAQTGDGGATLTNLRQRNAVANAASSLAMARSAAIRELPHEMILLDVYEALRALDELTGQTTADDVLNLIFSSFCIGK